MDVITNFGIGGIGFVAGYIFFLSIKRYFLSEKPPSPRELVLFMGSLVGGFGLGTIFHAEAFIGPYGIGMMAGTMFNLFLTLLTEILFYWIPRILGLLHEEE